MNQISFISANFVARELGYAMTEGWMQGDTATQDYFRPIEHFAQRFDAMLKEVSRMGFGAIDLWGAHLHPSWASDEHLRQASQLLKARGLQVTSLAAWCGSLEAVKGFSRVANAVGTNLLAGGAPVLASDRASTVAILNAHGLRLGIENHPEKTPRELLEQIGDGANGVIGAAPDSGWWATQGYSAAQAILELREHIFTLHLKDVLSVGAHQTCRFGAGVADIPGCVKAIREIGYAGPIGIEHEPEQFDPTEDVLASKVLLERWLGGKV